MAKTVSAPWIISVLSLVCLEDCPSRRISLERLPYDPRRRKGNDFQPFDWKPSTSPIVDKVYCSALLANMWRLCFWALLIKCWTSLANIFPTSISRFIRRTTLCARKANENDPHRLIRSGTNKVWPCWRSPWVPFEVSDAQVRPSVSLSSHCLPI